MTTVLRHLIPIAAGAALGAVIGCFDQCSSGACPLTSTWWRGAPYGAFLALVWSLGPRPNS